MKYNVTKGYNHGDNLLQQRKKKSHKTKLEADVNQSLIPASVYIYQSH